MRQGAEGDMELSLQGVELWDEEVVQLKESLPRELTRLLGDGDHATLSEYCLTMLVETRKSVGAIKAALEELVGTMVAASLGGWLREWVKDLRETQVSLVGEEGVVINSSGGGGQGQALHLQRNQQDAGDDDGMWEEVPQPAEGEEEDDDKAAASPRMARGRSGSGGGGSAANGNGGGGRGGSRLFASALAASVRSARDTPRTKEPPARMFQPQRRQRGAPPVLDVTSMAPSSSRRGRSHGHGDVGPRVVTLERKEGAAMDEEEDAYERRVSLVHTGGNGNGNGNGQQRRRPQGGGSSPGTRGTGYGTLGSPSAAATAPRASSPMVFHITGFEEEELRAQLLLTHTPTSHHMNRPPHFQPAAPWSRGGGRFGDGARGAGYGPMRGGRGAGRGGFHPYRRPHSFPMPGWFKNKSIVLGPPKSPSGAAAAGVEAAAPAAALSTENNASPLAPVNGNGVSPPISAFQHRSLVRDPATGRMRPPTKNKVWVNPNLAAASGAGGGGSG